MGNNWQPPKFNTKVHEPTLTDVLNQYKRDALLETSCHAMATVISFNSNDTSLSPSRPTVNCRINYPRTVFLPDNAGNIQSQLIKYPDLHSIPLVIMGGGGGDTQDAGASLTFPITAGDQVFLLFNDRSLNNWKNGSTGTGTAIDSSRLHDISDAVALIGFPLFPAASSGIPAYSSTYALLSNGAAQVGVGGGKVLITNDINQVNNLYSLLANLITAIEGLTFGTGVTFTGTSVSGGAVTINAGNSGTPTSTTSLNAAKTALAALLA